MHDPTDIYRFGHSSHWLAASQYEAKFANVLNEELKPAASAFLDNMMRVRNLGALVPEIAFWIRIHARISDVARFRLGRSIDLPGRVRGADPIDDELKNEVEKVFHEWRETKPPSGEAWRDGCDLMRVIVDSVPEHHGLGLETLMSAILLETWAAVEALVGDIWTVALDLFPDPLAVNVLGNDKNLPLQILRRYGFNVQDKMGNIVRVTNKVDMNSLSGIRAAYKSAFIDSNPEEIFDVFDPDIYHLEAIRNLFAHRSGRIDDKFLKRVEKSSVIGRYSVGDKFAIKGDLVSFYTGRSVDFATEVFLFVDRWIYANRTT